LLLLLLFFADVGGAVGSVVVC